MTAREQREKEKKEEKSEKAFVLLNCTNNSCHVAKCHTRSKYNYNLACTLDGGMWKQMSHFASFLCLMWSLKNYSACILFFVLHERASCIGEWKCVSFALAFAYHRWEGNEWGGNWRVRGVGGGEEKILMSIDVEGANWVRKKSTKLVNIVIGECKHVHGEM